MGTRPGFGWGLISILTSQPRHRGTTIISHNKNYCKHILNYTFVISSRATRSPVLALRALSMQCPRMYSKWFLRDLNLNDSVVVCGARVSVWSGSVILCYRHPAFSVATAHCPSLSPPRHPVCILTYHLSQSLLSPIHPVAVLSSIFSSLYCRSSNTHYTAVTLNY